MIAQQGWRNSGGTGGLGHVVYKGTWNATTNIPALASGGVGGVKGDYYVVSVAGSTLIDGISDWKVGDWIINNGTVWQKVDNTDSVTSVNGAVGVVTLGLSDILSESNSTGANDISVDSGQNITYNEGTGGNLVSTVTTGGVKTWSLPNNSGTIALVSDIPSVAITEDIMPRGNAGGTGIEDGTWSNVGNDIYPETTGSNIGDATHRIGTIFMASTINYNGGLTFTNTSVGDSNIFFEVELAPTKRKFIIAPSGYVEGVTDCITFKSASTAGVIIEGFNGSDNNYALQIYNSGRAITTAQFENNGDIILSPETGVVTRSRTTIGTVTPVSNAKLTVRGASVSLGEVAMYVGGSTGTTGLQVQNDNRIGIGALGTSTKLNVKGTGATLATTTVNFINSSSSIGMKINDDTHIGMGTSPSSLYRLTLSAASGLNSMINIAASNLASNGSGIRITATSTAGECRGIYASAQAIAGQTARGLYGDSITTTPNTNIGVYGRARNATSISIGVKGEAVGGASAAGSSYTSGIEGANSNNVSLDKRGVYGISTNASATNTVAYGGKFQATITGTTITNYGIHVLSSSSSAGSTNIGAYISVGTVGTNYSIVVPNANGQALFGAIVAVNTDAIIEITGGVQFNGNGTGFWMFQPDGTRRLITITNAGAFLIA